MDDGAAFRSLYQHGFARVGACTVRCALADPIANATTVLDAAGAVADEGAAVLVFPELCLSGYAIDDLLLQDALLDAVLDAIEALKAGTAGLSPLLLVGAPLRHGGRVYNAAVAVQGGRVLGVVPKVHLPNYREFYERRHFASGAGTEGGTIRLGGDDAPFGPDLLFDRRDPRLQVLAVVHELLGRCVVGQHRSGKRQLRVGRIELCERIPGLLQVLLEPLKSSTRFRLELCVGHLEERLGERGHASLGQIAVGVVG